MADGPYPELSERKPETFISTTLHPLRHLKGLSLFKGTQTPYRSYHTYDYARKFFAIGNTAPYSGFPTDGEKSLHSPNFRRTPFSVAGRGKDRSGKIPAPRPATNFRRPPWRHSSARGNARLRTDGRGETSTQAKQRKYGRNKTVKLSSAGQRKNLPRLTPIQTPRPNTAARVGSQFKRRASAVSVHNECGLPAFDFKLDLATHRGYD